MGEVCGSVKCGNHGNSWLCPYTTFFMAQCRMWEPNSKLVTEVLAVNENGREREVTSLRSVPSNQTFLSKQAEETQDVVEEVVMDDYLQGHQG